MKEYTDAEVDSILDEIDKNAPVQPAAPATPTPTATPTATQRPQVRTLPGDLKEYKNIGAATPITTPDAPALKDGESLHPGNLPGKTPVVVGADGNHRQHFGASVRVTDANGNEIGWEDANGNKIDRPASMAMVERGGLADNLTEQQAKLRANIQQRRDGVKEANRKRNELLSDLFFEATSRLNNGGDDVNVEMDDSGNPTRRSVTLAGEDLKMANDIMAALGRKDLVSGIVVEQRTSKEGDSEPVYYFRLRGADGKERLKQISLGEIQKQYANTHNDNMTPDEAMQNAVNAFGGKYNPLGVNMRVSDREKWQEQNRQAEAKLNEESKQFYAKLGLDEKKLQQTSDQFDKNYELALKADAREERKLDAQAEQIIRTADREDLKMAYEMVVGLEASGQKPTTDAILKAMGDKAVGQFYKIPMTNSEGNPILDKDGVPVMRPPQTEEEYERCTNALLDAVGALRGMNPTANVRNNWAAIMQAKAMIQGGNGGDGGAAPANPAMPTGGGAVSPEVEKKWGSFAAGGDTAPAAQPAQPAAPTGGTTDYAPQGASYFEDTVTRQREQALPAARPAQPAAQPPAQPAQPAAQPAQKSMPELYAAISPDIMVRFNEVFPDAKPEDIFAGKYDKNIRGLATAKNDQNALNALDAIGKAHDIENYKAESARAQAADAAMRQEHQRRMEAYNNEVEEAKKKIESDVERDAARYGWNISTINSERQRRLWEAEKKIAAKHPEARMQGRVPLDMPSATN